MGGRLEETNGWLQVSVWGGPRIRGRANGELMRDQMHSIMRMLDFTLLETHGLSRSALSEMLAQAVVGRSQELWLAAPWRGE